MNSHIVVKLDMHNDNEISSSDLSQEKTKTYDMKNRYLSILLLAISLINFSSFWLARG